MFFQNDDVRGSLDKRGRLWLPTAISIFQQQWCKTGQYTPYAQLFPFMVSLVKTLKAHVYSRCCRCGLSMFLSLIQAKHYSKVATNMPWNYFSALFLLYTGIWELENCFVHIFVSIFRRKLSGLSAHAQTTGFMCFFFCFYVSSQVSLASPQIHIIGSRPCLTLLSVPNSWSSEKKTCFRRF